MKKIVIAGGTGFIGTYIVERFQKVGYTVLIVSRNSEHISWNPIGLTEALEDAEAVINLAGKSISCLHTEENRKAIIESRINTTLWLGNALLSCVNPPKLWINASATGIYKSSFDHLMTEDETEYNNDFLAEVVKHWEKTFFAFELSETRQIALRTSVVLGKGGGALQPLVTLSRLWLGGKQGDGRQIMSWIHEEDYFQILRFLIASKNMYGVINCTSPQPIPNREFMEQLRNCLRVPIGISAPEFAVKIGAWLRGIEPDLVLNSVNVYPKRLLDADFQFLYPDTAKTLKDLLKQ
jgi:uncharacterized protein